MKPDKDSIRAILLAQIIMQYGRVDGDGFVLDVNDLPVSTPFEIIPVALGGVTVLSLGFPEEKE